MKVRFAASAMFVASTLIACSGSQPTTPLPGGLPPEYEPPRPFPSAAPSAAPSSAPAAGAPKS
jgi:hypothetical protein